MAKAQKAEKAESADVAATGATGTESAADAAPMVRFKDFLDRVVARSGTRKKDAKGVVEATLAVLGEALAKGEALNLPELGKARVNRQKGADGVATMVVKLRRTAPKAVKVTPAEAAE
jgi:nucleoid DNA-binding protein